jgi:nitroreductase
MILDLMKKRRSVRLYKPEAPADDVLEKLIEAAITAPSAGNKQPWRFLIIKDRDTIMEASRIVKKECSITIANIRAEFAPDYKNYSDNFSKFENAPFLIVPIYRVHKGFSNALFLPGSAENKSLFQDLEYHSILLSVGMTIQNIQLMGEEIGIGTCCMTGPLVGKIPLENLLKIPEEWHIAAFIAVGYPDEKPFDPGRKSLKTFLRWL